MANQLYRLAVCTMFCLCFSCAHQSDSFLSEGSSAGNDACSQPADVLQRAVVENPQDPRAHFRLGVCRLEMGNNEAAANSFSEALALQGDYGVKIAEAYKKAAVRQFREDNAIGARKMFALALQYNPGLTSSVADFYLRQGKKAGDLGCYAEAIAMDPDNRGKICPAVVEQGRKSKGAAVLEAYSFAHEHGCMKRNAEKHAGEQLLEIARGIPIDERKPYLALAETFLGKYRVEQAFPPPGTTPGLPDKDLQW